MSLAAGRYRPQSLREDRILVEAHATRGDARAISDLFGLSIAGTDRYIGTLEHPDLTVGDQRDLRPMWSLSRHLIVFSRTVGVSGQWWSAFVTALQRRVSCGLRGAR